MPRKKKSDTNSNTNGNTNVTTKTTIKKKRGRKKKKTLDNDDIVVIDLKKNNDEDFIKNNINEKNTFTNTDLNSNKIDNTMTITTNNTDFDDTTTYSSDLILHLKTNNQNIIGANINNDSRFAPFNSNINNINNNINSSINSSISGNISGNIGSNLTSNPSNKNTAKNIFSFINVNKNTSNNDSNNGNLSQHKSNIEYKYVRSDNLNSDTSSNISSNTSNNILNQDLQKIMRNNIRKIKYSFDNNRKWLCKSNVHCLWCCHQFDTVPIAIPKKVCGDTFHLFGYFCSFNCSASYIFETSVLASNKWEYYSLLCLLQKKITGDKSYKKINFAPPRECLKIFGGFLSIEEFREQFNLVDYNVMLPPMIPIESTIENSIVQRQR